MESKKCFMYVNPAIRSDTRSFLISSFNNLELFWLLFVLCFLKSSLSLPTERGKCQEFLVQNVRLMLGMSGICDFRLEWQP